ncbi:hypothetical protein DOTSEDRAFT_36526 [Dothistroma septosporum NZE10]|uniref:F-box domain-containing protein n=1 Tax=Dothistroma septosporum (strain NZE10 / CBS 128990) TaxID=675120 RepID=N1PMN3_DOTSN|nr:hypothetical protein DOTSEDRAFT_36526 [Dothistroma septosporum NZE10]
MESQNSTSYTVDEKTHTSTNARHRQPELESIKARANFFMLPPEIRAVIYELILTAPGPLSFSARTKKNLAGLPVFPGALLQVSRQVRQQVLPVFWAVTAFEFTSSRCDRGGMLEYLKLRDLQKWKIPLDDSGIAMISKLTLRLF